MPVRLLALVLFAAGCSSSNAASHNPTQCAPPSCAVAPLTLAAVVTPASNPTSPNVLGDLDVAEVVLDSNGLFDVTLQPLIHISGKVSVGRGGAPGLSSGTVLATRPSRILGLPDRSYQALLDPVSGLYDLAVSPSLGDELYTLRIVSSDTTQYPPQTFRVQADSNTTFDLMLDDPSSLIQVSGKIVDAVMNPMVGLAVQAVDPLSKALVSTSTVTDNNGVYLIRLASSVRKLAVPTLQLQAAPTNKSPSGTPELRANIDLSGTTTVITGNLAVPPLPATARFSYQVTGTGSSGAELPVANASVQLTAIVTDPKAMPSQVEAIFRASATTDTQGYITVDLIPSGAQSSRSYDVAVSPPSTSAFQSAVFSLTVGPTGGVGQAIKLPLRPQLSGRVIDMRQKAVPGVSVQPAPATVGAALDATSLAEVVNLSSATTDKDGRFVQRIDSGLYDLGFIPLTQMLLPRRWLPSLPVMMDTDLGDILLPMGALVQAYVTGPGGAPLAGATVQLYSVSSANAACPKGQLTCLQPPRLAADGTTASDGSVPMLLPAQVGPVGNAR